MVSVCSPNYLHDAHCRLAMRLNTTAICEKPLVISPWNLDQLMLLEGEYEAKVRTVLQLRLHDEALRLKASLAQSQEKVRDVNLTYVTRRGSWYHQSWKGQEEKSGGLIMNIGIHFFDLLLWLFGPPKSANVTARTNTRIQGRLELEKANVNWLLSVDINDLPPGHLESGKHAHRALTTDDDSFDFSTGFDDLHTRVYRQILEGGGYGIEDARPSIELVHRLRTLPLST